MTSQLYQPISSSSRTSSESSLNDEVHYYSEEEPKRKLDTQSSVSSEVSFHLILYSNEKMFCNPCYPTCILLVSHRYAAAK